MRWIKLNASIAEHWIWQDAEKLKWWLDLILLAAWKDRKQLVGKQVVLLQRGQLIAPISYLCKRWKRSRTMVENFLKNLQEDGMILKGTTNTIAVITITNYEMYQNKNSASESAYESATERAYESASEKATEKASQHLCESASCKGRDASQKATESATESAYQSATESATESVTERATNVEYNNNIYNNNIYKLKEDSLHSSSCADKSAQNSAVIDFEKFVEFFNQEIDANNSTIPHIKAITEKRKKMIQARIREHGKNSLVEVVRLLVSSDYLNGKNDRGWVADIDWMLKPNNYIKISEGNYQDKNNDTDKRRTTEVPTATAEDYNGSF